MPDLAKVSSVAGEVAVLDDGGGTKVKSAAAEVAVIDDGGGTRVKSVAAEVAILSGEGGTRVKSAAAEVVLIDTLIPQIVLSDITGQPNQVATFDASASLVDTYTWTWTSVPGGSAVGNLLEEYPEGTPVTKTEFPDNGVTSPIDMTDNELLCHFNGNANDSSGNGRDGTVNGSTQVAGFIGSNAYSFDGSNDYINYGSELQYTTEDFTFSLWMKPEGTQNQWAMVFGTHGNNNGYALQQNSTSTNQYRFQTSSGSSYFANNSTFTLAANQWSHVVITRSGAVIKGYVNGIHVYTDVAASTIYNALDFNISRYPEPSWAGWWKGEIDEFASWSRVLSEAEITNIYSLQKTSVTSPTSPIDMTSNKALFHFNNNSDDSSGWGNTLTLTDTAFVDGKLGSNSLGFNSSNSMATMDTTVDLSGGNWTIAFWFYNLKPTGSWRTATRGTTVDHQIIVENNSNRLGVYANNNGNFRASGFEMPSADYQGWHHMVAVGSGTTTTFYINGVFGGASDRKSVADIKAIGNHTGAGQQFADRIDEFAVWTRALSSSEIANIFLRQSGSYAGPGVSTLPFTPDISGTYVVELTSLATGLNNSLSQTAEAVISIASDGTAFVLQGNNYQDILSYYQSI